MKEKVDWVFFSRAVGIAVTIGKFETKGHFGSVHIQKVLFEGRCIESVGTPVKRQ